MNQSRVALVFFPLENVGLVDNGFVYLVKDLLAYFA